MKTIIIRSDLAFPSSLLSSDADLINAADALGLAGAAKPTLFGPPNDPTDFARFR
jgi:hypothetical protein